MHCGSLLKIVIKKGKKMAMVPLSELSVGQRAVIRKVLATDSVFDRLAAMGFVKGNRLTMLRHTISKQTFDIRIEDSDVALRTEEAKMIVVEPQSEGIDE